MVGTVIGEHSACSSKQDPDSRLFVPVSGGYVRPPEGMFSFGFVRFWLVFFVCSLDTVILSIYHLIMFLNRPLFIIADSVLLLLPFVHCTYISSSLLIYSVFFSTFNYFFFFFFHHHTLSVILTSRNLASRLQNFLLTLVRVLYFLFMGLHLPGLICDPFCSHTIHLSLPSIPLFSVAPVVETTSILKQKLQSMAVIIMKIFLHVSFLCVL